jgi:hypothetical protein
VPGTIGSGLEIPAEPVDPTVLTESVESNPRPAELGVDRSIEVFLPGLSCFSFRFVGFVLRFTSAGTAGTGGASSTAGGSGEIPIYEEATAVPAGTIVVACWNSEGTLIRLAAGDGNGDL